MPNPTQSTPRLVRFQAFTVDLRLGELRKNGTKIRLQEQPFRVLALLLEHPAELVTREEFRQRLWPSDTFVDFDHGLNAAINRLRDKLNDDAEKPRYIETIPRRGYRFIATIEATPIQESKTAEVSGSQPAWGSGRRLTRWSMAVALLVLLAIVVLLAIRRPLRGRMAQDSAGSIRSIAVLPLANLSNDSSQEYFADGMTDELISDLAQISALRVISRTSVMTYKNTRMSLPEIGKQLNVDAVVEGSVERSGDLVRISAQLVRTSTDSHLWAKTYERNLGDVISLQDEVAGAIASEIRIKLLPAEKTRLTTTRTVKPDAYEAYLRGLYHAYKRDRADLEQSAVYFQRATQIDPEYALAYAGLADSYALQGSLLYMVLAPRDVMPKSKAAALRALELDSDLGEAYTTLAYVETLYDWDWDKSEADFKHALALKPNYAQAHLWYAMHLAAMGRHGESIAEVKRAQELDPLSLIMNTSVGLMYYFAGRYDESIQLFHKALELDPNFFVAHWELGLAYEEKGMLEEARSELEKASNLSPDNPTIRESLAEIDALSGRKAQAREVLRQLTQAPKKEFVSPYVIALLNATLGDKDAAFRALEQACEQRDNNLIFLAVDPGLRGLRGDARYPKLLERIGLAKS
jgi:TolB-like protein/DNA-binding winged helix-turn-helix (wHTH) protein/Flp pilus assembly protein TadD